MKIIMIYDQIQSGAGIKDDHDIPLGAKKEAVGPAVMMEPFLKKVDGKVVACLYCRFPAQSDDAVAVLA